MAPSDHEVPYGDLNIGGQVVSTLHQQRYNTTHFNTIRAQHRAHAGNTTKSYITTSRNRIHQMRDTGNIIPLERGHMRLSTQARKTTNLILSNPELTEKQRAKCVNALAGVFTKRSITRDRSILEVAATVTGSALSSRSSRAPCTLPVDRNVPQEAAAGLPTPNSAGPLPELTNDRPGGAMEELRVPGTLPLEKPGPSHQPPARRTITRQGTEVFCGLATPINSPIKAPGEQSLFAITERDVEMDDTSTDAHGLHATPSPGPGFDSLPPLETKPQFDMASIQNELASLRRANAALLEKEGYVRRKLSRTGQGTISNLETVVDRAVRQRDELRVENQELRAVIEGLESRIIDLQGQIVHTQDKLDRAESERIQMAQSKRRWIARMLASAGRLPGEFRVKDAEIDSMREKLVGMHARLAQEQSQLRDHQVQLEEERKKRMGVETELGDTRMAHAQEIENRNLAGRRLKEQLKQMVNNLDSGSISI